jgi:hypothetical protein
MEEGEFMTRYFLNDQEISTSTNFVSFDQLLKHMEASYLTSDAVIRMIHIDGNPFTLDDLSGGAIVDLEKLEKVEIFTSKLIEVAKDSIDGALEYLSRVERLLPELSIKFQDAPDSDAFENLRQLYEGFYFINLLLDKLVAGYHIQLDEAIVGGVAVREHLKKFISVLKELIECKQNGDYPLIADILEYEILPGVAIWKDIFDFVSKKINMTQ